LSAGSRHTGTVAEVLVKGGVVFLHSRCSAAVAVVHLPIDHIEACLPLIQSQFVMGSASPWEVLVAKLDIEDPIRCCALYRGEDLKATQERVLVVPVRVDAVVVGCTRQALVTEGRIGSGKLGIAVGR